MTNEIKPRRGPKLKFDFSGLKQGETVELIEKAATYPSTYINNWNSRKGNFKLTHVLINGKSHAKRVK